MDDFNNPFDPDEINKIQQEIDRDLNKSQIQKNEEQVHDTESIIADKTDNTSHMESNIGKREVAHQEETLIVPSDPSNIGNQNFIKETIKHDTNKQNKGKFARLIALVCIASILAGSAMGIMMPFANNFIIPAIRNENPVAKNEDNSNFSFSLPEESKLSDKDMEFTKTYSEFSSSMSFAGLVDQVEPSVVGITSMVDGQAGYGLFGIPGESPNKGSGIIFDEDSTNVYIVSNNHVTNNAKSVMVSVSGSEGVPAKFVGKEAQSDLVVLSVSKDDLKKVGIDKVTVAKFGSSSQMRVGDFAIAIGNALGEGNTATFGFISAVDKEVSVDDRVLKVLQTDAAINPGNSGGPLINLNGEVIGINTLKLSETSVEGMGYSITSDVAMPIIEQLRNKTPSPVLGITGYTMTGQIAQAFNLPEMGVVVDSVMQGSSAEKAGIKRIDVITSFKGEAVFTMEQLSEKVKACSVGEKVEIKVIRQGVDDPIVLHAVLSEMTDDNF